MYNRLSLELRTRSHPKPARMFQWAAVDNSPDLAGRNVLETFKWLRLKR